MACTLKINGVEIDQQTLAAIMSTIANDPNFKNAVAYENYIRLTKDEQEVRPTVLTYLKDTLGYANEQEVRDGIAAESARREAFTGKNTNPAWKRFKVAVGRGNPKQFVKRLFSNRGVWGLYGKQSRRLKDAQLLRDGEINAWLLRASELTKAFQARIEKFDKFLDEDDKIAIGNVLNGAKWSSVPFSKLINDPKKRAAIIQQLDPGIKSMREHIDQGTKKITTIPGLVSPLQSKIFTDNLGKYTTILYEAHRNPDFAYYFEQEGRAGGDVYEKIYNAAIPRVKDYISYEAKVIDRTIRRKNTAINSLISKQPGLTGNDLLANQSNVEKLRKDISTLQERANTIKNALADPELLNIEVVNMLRFMDSSENLTNALTAGGYRGAISKAIFKKRSNIPKEIRELFGQVKDPLLVYQATIAKMATIIANAEYQNKIADINEQLLKGKGKTPPIFSTQPIPSKGVTTKIKLPDSFSVLADRLGTKEVYVLEDLAEFFEESQFGKSTTGFFAFLSSVNTLAKLNATVGSLPTQERNLLANLLKLATVIGQKRGRKAFGQFFRSASRRFKGEAGEAARILRIRKGEIPPNTFHERLQFVLTQQGIKSSEVTTADINEEIKNNKLIDRWADLLNATETGKILSDIAKYPVALARRAYAASDDIVKEAIFYAEADAYADAFFDKSYEDLIKTGTPAEIKQVEDAAGSVVRRMLPNYSNAWEISKALQKYGGGLVAPFAAFRLEQMRTIIGSVGVIGDEYNNTHPDPKVRKKLKRMGVRRLLSFSALIAMSSQAILSLLGGLDDEEEDYVRKWYIPDFVENPYISIDGDGNYEITDGASVNLYGSVGLIDRYLGDLMSSDPALRDDAIWNILKKIIQPLIDPQLAASAVLSAFFDQDQYGNKIFSPNDDDIDKVFKFLEVAFEPIVVPATFRNRINEKTVELERKAEDYYNLEKSGAPKEQLDLAWADLKRYESELNNERFAFIPGVRFYTIDPKSQLPRKIFEAKDRLGNISTDYKNRINEIGKKRRITNEDRDKVFNELLEGYQEDIMLLKEYYQDSKYMGHNVDNVLTLSPIRKGEKILGDMKPFFSKKITEYIMGKTEKIPDLKVELYEGKAEGEEEK